MKVPIFFLKKGHWGEGGMVKVPWYLWLIKQSDYTNKVRWVKLKCHCLSWILGTHVKD